jgi:hypothetical protein
MFWPFPATMRAKLIEAGEFKCVPSSRECDDFDSKVVAALQKNGTPKVLPCLALSAPKQTIVSSRIVKVTKSIQKQVDSHLFAALAAFLASLSLECETLRSVAVGTPLETVLEIVLFFSLVVFAVELLVRYAVEEGYCWTAWFPLDLLATVTLLMELRWFQDLAFQEDCTMFSHSQDHVAQVGGRAAHALRVARVLRVLRFARVIKLCRLLVGLPVCSEEVVPKVQRKFRQCRDKVKQNVAFQELSRQVSGQCRDKVKLTAAVQELELV